MNTPAVAAVGHYFLLKRGTAMGVAYISGSLGGIVFPLMLQSLLPTVGFAWSARILAFVLLLLIVLANLLIRTRLPPTPAGRLLPDFSVFKDSAFAFCTLGIFFLEWGLFVPLAYISSYAVDHGHTATFSFQIVAVLNAGSFFGRWLPGLLSDKMGRYNIIIITIALCVITILALWLPTQNSETMLILFVVCFGFASGSNLSLAPVCVGQLCRTENYARYYSTCYTIASFGYVLEQLIHLPTIANSHVQNTDIASNRWADPVCQSKLIFWPHYLCRCVLRCSSRFLHRFASLQSRSWRT